MRQDVTLVTKCICVWSLSVQAGICLCDRRHYVAQPDKNSAWHNKQ